MIREKLIELMTYRKMTIQSLSDSSGLSVETVKNLIYGKVTDPRLSTILPLCHALNCSSDYLIGNGQVAFQQARDFSSHSTKLIEKVIDVEYTLTCKANEDAAAYRTVFLPTRFLSNTMSYDSNDLAYIDVSGYLKCYPGETISCGVAIRGNEYEPVYFDEDIILVNCERYPHTGEIGVFLSSDKVYIRRYQYAEHGKSRLCSVHGRGADVLLSSGKYFCFGTVLGVFRGEMKLFDTSTPPSLDIDYSDAPAV